MTQSSWTSKSEEQLSECTITFTGGLFFFSASLDYIVITAASNNTNLLSLYNGVPSATQSYQSLVAWNHFQYVYSPFYTFHLMFSKLLLLGEKYTQAFPFKIILLEMQYK